MTIVLWILVLYSLFFLFLAMPLEARGPSIADHAAATPIRPSTGEPQPVPQRFDLAS